MQHASVLKCPIKQNLAYHIRQHEKFSSQLQLNQRKPPEKEACKSEAKPSKAAAAEGGGAAAAKPPEASRVEDKTPGEKSKSMTQISVFRCHFHKCTGDLGYHIDGRCGQEGFNVNKYN